MNDDGPTIGAGKKDKVAYDLFFFSLSPFARSLWLVRQGLTVLSSISERSSACKVRVTRRKSIKKNIHLSSFNHPKSLLPHLSLKERQGKTRQPRLNRLTPKTHPYLPARPPSNPSIDRVNASLQYRSPSPEKVQSYSRYKTTSLMTYTATAPSAHPTGRHRAQITRPPKAGRS